MAHYSIDRDGVVGARHALDGDPQTLRDCAGELSVAAAAATVAVGAGGGRGGGRGGGTGGPGVVEGDRLRAALQRFRVVQATALDAVADAWSALGGDLDQAVAGERDTELAVMAAFGATTGRVGLAPLSGPGGAA